MNSYKTNIQQMKFNLAEISGGLGDLGTFIPLVVSLVAVCGMDGGTILLFAGLFNIITGILFNQPIPVQPMKAIAAVAIAEGLMPGEIVAAGFVAGAIVFFLGFSGLITFVEKLVPRPVVRGIQLGVGLKLAVKGIALVMATSWWQLDGRITALAVTIFILATSRLAKFPVALIIFTAGLILLIFEQTDVFSQLDWGWRGPQLVIPSLSQWQSGALKGALPQLPLTLLNSVIAICALSSDYFPGKGIKVKAMSISVGLMNLVGSFFGAMPVCHGSGGLAAQYRFGARTGGSVVILGTCKVFIALAFGTAAISILKVYPVSILGVLLIFSGIELSLPARDSIHKESFLVVAATTAGILAANSAVGFIFGLVTAFFVLRPNSKR